MLERTPKSPPKIEPLADDMDRPPWSVMIPSYNCINHLRDAINSVLVQAPSAEGMQIEVIDDCSTDGDIEALVNEFGEGRVGFFRQPKNVGSLRNFATCINRAKGRLIHILHGDDTVKPGFYQEINSLFENYPDIGAAFTGCTNFDEKSVPKWDYPIILDKSGIIDSFLLKSAEKILLQASSIVVKRSVYEHLGSFFGVHYGEDWEMWTRIAAHYEVAYSPKSLANYRVHTNNITGNSFVIGKNIKDMAVVIDIIQDYLPKEDRRLLRKKAKRNYAFYVITIADQLYHEENNPKAALLQAREVFKFYPSIDTFFCLLKISVKVLIRYQGKMQSTFK